MNRWLSTWPGALALGLWLSISAVWPVQSIALGSAHFLIQPALLFTLILLALAQSRELGHRQAWAQSLWLFAVLTLAAWLPALRRPEASLLYPPAYEGYLRFYEAALAGVIGWQAVHAARSPTAGRARVLAPLLIVARGAFLGHPWSLLVGTVLGGALAFARAGERMRRAGTFLSERTFLATLFAASALLVFAAGFRVYSVDGPNYPFSSDDGPSYYKQAMAMAEHPTDFFTPKLNDEISFTGYYAVMGLWYWLTAATVPAGLILHGLAAGILALSLYWLGRALGNRQLGFIVAAAVMLDHVMLHLMATMNMETFYIPALYVALVLWVRAAARPASAGNRLYYFAGLTLGLATVFRPTGALFPFALGLLMLLERPRPTWRQAFSRMVVLIVGFAVPLALLLIRNRIAWGYWTLGGMKSHIAIGMNPALAVKGLHVVEVGFKNWIHLLCVHPSTIWTTMIPEWWATAVRIWTHPGFGQMDLAQGINEPGPYQAALTTILSLGVIVGAVAAWQAKTRLTLAALSLPLYCTSLVLVFYFQNSARYRSPFVPALYLLAGYGFFLAYQALRRAGPVVLAPRPWASPQAALRLQEVT